MGEDGHVASLFAGAAQSEVDSRHAYLAIGNSPKPPPNRVTLSYAALAAAGRVWVLATGPGKSAALRESLDPAGSTPLARVLKARKTTCVFTDITLC